MKILCEALTKLATFLFLFVRDTLISSLSFSQCSRCGSQHIKVSSIFPSLPFISALGYLVYISGEELGSDIVFSLHASRYCVMKLTERLKQEGIDINLRDALGVDTDPKLRNLRGKL